MNSFVPRLEEAPFISPNLLLEENIRHIEYPVSRSLTHKLKSTGSIDWDKVDSLVNLRLTECADQSKQKRKDEGRLFNA